MNLFGYDMILFGYDLILIGSKFQVHKPSVLLVAVLINGVKKQVLQVSFEITVGDLVSFHNFGSAVKLFRSDLIYDMILFGSYFKIQELSAMLVASLTNFGVKNQVPQFFFNFAAGDLVLVSYYEVADILFFDSVAISKGISNYGSQAFSLHSPMASQPLVTCSSPHRTGKEEDFMHPPGHLLLTLRDIFTTHGLIFMD